MKLKIRNIIVLSLTVVCVFAFAGCFNDTVIDRLKNRYYADTELLEDYEIVCDISGETFTGYATHYAVILFKAEPTAFLQSYIKDESFVSEKNEEIKNAIDSHACIEIPAEYYPDWDEDYIWRGSAGYDGMYMIYFPKNLKLIIFEAGH